MYPNLHFCVEKIKNITHSHMSHTNVKNINTFTYLITENNYEDIHNSWLYCFTNPLELGTRVSLVHRQPYVCIQSRPLN